MNVWPAAGITAGKDGRESHFTVAVSDLYAAQIIFGDDAAGIKRVLTILVAMPEINGIAFERSTTGIDVDELQGDGERYAAGNIATSSTKAGPDVIAHNTGERQDIDQTAAIAVGTIAWIRAGRFFGNGRAAAA